MKKELFTLKIKVKPIFLNGTKYFPLKAKFTAGDCTSKHELSNSVIFEGYLNNKVRELLDLNQEVTYINNRPCFRAEHLPDWIEVAKHGFLTDLILTIRETKG